MNCISVNFFGPLQELAGAARCDFEFCSNTSELKSQILERYPILRDRAFSIAVDGMLSSGELPIQPGSEVAVLPPFSGG